MERTENSFIAFPIIDNFKPPLDYISRLYAIVQSIPHSIKPELTDPFEDRQVICFNGSVHPEPRPENLNAHITLPKRPLTHHIITVTDISQIVKPIKFLYKYNSSPHGSSFRDYPQPERHLHLNLSENINAVDLCIVYRCNVKDDIDKHFYPGVMMPPHLVVDVSLRIELSPWKELKYSDFKKLIQDLNEAGLNIKLCNVTNYLGDNQDYSESP